LRTVSIFDDLTGGKEQFKREKKVKDPRHEMGPGAG